jgi:hypothetical protein
MLRRMQDWMKRDVGEGGGGATAVVEAPETETVEEVTETVDEGAEDTTETVEEEPTKTTEEPEVVAPTPGGDLKKALHEERVEKKALKERLDALETRLGETAGAVDKLRPPEKHALESWYEALPDGNLESEKPGEKEAAEFKQDAGLLLRVMKNPEFTKAFLAPVLPLMQAMFRSLDLQSWQNEQMVEAFTQLGDVELGQPERDAEGNVVKAATKLADKLPIGLKHRERILKEHAEMVKKGGGKWVPVRTSQDAFKALLEGEERAANAAGGKAAEAATRRTLKEVTQRRTATGGPRSEVTPARGGPIRSGRRTPEQIEKSGVDFVIP